MESILNDHHLSKNMTNSQLILELEKLDLTELKKIATLWGVSKIPVKEKNRLIEVLSESFLDSFYLKGVLEKFTPLQVSIYTNIIKNKNVLTLGEISRKVNIPPINVEMELALLCKYHLVYQRKNRERLTNNLDKYHAFPEIAALVPLVPTTSIKKINLSIKSNVEKLKINEIGEEWIKGLGLKRIDTIKNFLQFALSDEGFATLVKHLPDAERDLVYELYQSGGIKEANSIRMFISLNRGKPEPILRSLIAKNIIVDLCFIEDKFVRLYSFTQEFFEHLDQHPIIIQAKKGNKQRQEKITSNELDFFVNTKKLISYISRKGLLLAKSGKIKQSDHKRTEQELLNPDISIFSEKGEIYQIELILPILRLINLVDIKNECVVLNEEYSEYLKKDIFEIMSLLIQNVHEARQRRIPPPAVFEASEMPFYDKSILDDCVRLILETDKIHLSVIFSKIIRNRLVYANTFKVLSFEEELLNLRKEIISVIFYLHLFGLLTVEYPSRYISISELGLYYFKTKELTRQTERGGITINPDFSIIAFPDKVSIFDIHLLKIFTDLKDFDRVYTFSVTKDALQSGILLGNKLDEFIEFLSRANKSPLAQNLVFLLKDWGGNLPILEITEDCVLVRAKDVNSMDLLLGQIKGKKMVLEEISPTAVLIDRKRVNEVIPIAEKLNLIVKLTR